jgi:hypothetical protein
MEETMDDTLFVMRLIILMCLLQVAMLCGLAVMTWGLRRQLRLVTAFVLETSGTLRDREVYDAGYGDGNRTAKQEVLLWRLFHSRG